MTMRTPNLARPEIEKMGSTEVGCAAFSVQSHSQEAVWYPLSTAETILNPRNKEIYVDGV